MVQLPRAQFRIAFFGTDRFSMYSLHKLHANLHGPSQSRIVRDLTIITPPDAPSQRGLQLRPCPVKSFALDHSIPVFQPTNPKTIRDWKPEFLSAPRPNSITLDSSIQTTERSSNHDDDNPDGGGDAIGDQNKKKQEHNTRGHAFDLAVVVSFRYLIPYHIISAFRLGGINVHPSLLPQFKGPAPIHHTILNGESTTGVSIIDLDPVSFDVGRVLDRCEVPIENPKAVRYPLLEDHLGHLGADRMMYVIQKMSDLNARLPGSTQDELPQPVNMVFARKISKQMHHLQFSQLSAVDVDRRFRALAHSHVFGVLDGIRVRLLDLAPCEDSSATQILSGIPGSAVFHTDAILVRCTDGSVVAIKELQMEGKRAVSAKDFFHGYQNKIKRAGVMDQSRIMEFQ
ncbi:mitochondrial methionyl-tRNA formyltransferase [Andalucia godoyi]|uniref:methionyl-tRNA formyltransferase n=1 Tax=Andalucia godoyi TaxID=505711 RepID=A0A8K0AI85_ANDGO|nr:mitochondrial methionyl-tRNA formyltransferase [Andalucia godoyi]|eukprot:ANDGO_03809.mRNA.1 mitochondrial methionyl-tRNA formyltransferase